MRLTNRFSVMGRKYDLAYGQASTWKRKLKNDKYELIENAIDKLGQLEDIEEELGIDLFILFKALTEGMYVRNEKMAMIYDINLKEKRFESGCFNDYGMEEYEYYYFKDYGKTWALTKEELEK